MKGLILKAIEQVYLAAPFVINDTNYEKILEEMRKLSCKNVRKIVGNKKTLYYIKKRVQYFFHHILKNQENEEKGCTTLLVPSNELILESPNKNKKDQNEFISFEELSQTVFKMIDTPEDFPHSYSAFEKDIVPMVQTNTFCEERSFSELPEAKKSPENVNVIEECNDAECGEGNKGQGEKSGNVILNLDANEIDLGNNNFNENFTVNLNESSQNDKEKTVDNFINESSVDKRDFAENSFAVTLLKSIRSKYLTPEVCTHLNRKVRMVEGKKKVRHFNFKCSIQDTKMQIPEIAEILCKNRTQFPLTKVLEDFIRIVYMPKNNACEINFKNLRINQNSFVAYAYCIDLECNTYVFNGNKNGDISVFRSQEEIIHSLNKTKQFQCRGVQRFLYKAELSTDSALTFQKNKVNKQSDELRVVGRSQMVKSLSNIRNIKAESAAENDRDSDPFVDTYLMLKSDYNHYIQHISTKLEVFLWSKKQLEILRKKNDFILRKMNYTLHVDATGHVVDEMPFQTKRIFLYSLVGHIKEKNIVFSVADAILSNHTSYDIGRFFKGVEHFCIKNKIKWPICKRIVTDVSLAIIGAINKDINNISSLLEYLNKCYEIAIKHNAEKQKCSFVCIQFCVSHYSKIICKDIDNIVPLTNVKLRKFLREAFGIVFNLMNIVECVKWFEQLCIVLCTKKHIKNVNNALIYLKGILNQSEVDIDIRLENCEKTNFLSEEDENMGNISSHSPFRILFEKYKSDINTCDEMDAEENIFFCPEVKNLLLQKYIPFLPMWSNIIGSIIDFSSKRVSNGPIETYFKDIKHNELKGRKIKLGRFVRTMENFTKYKTKKIKIEYINIFGKAVSPGTLVTPSKNKGLKRKKKIKTQILEIDSKKRLSKISESWNKKLKRLPHSLFNNNFEMLNKPMEEFQKTCTDIINNVESDNIKSDANICNKIEPESNFCDENETKIQCINDLTNLDKSDQCKNEKCASTDFNNSFKKLSSEIKPKRFISVEYKTLNRFVRSEIEFYLLKLENVFQKTHGEHFALTSYLTLKELDTLNDNNWLSTVIVDASITCLMFESNIDSCLYIACQTGSYCFKNEQLLIDYLSRNPRKVIVL